MTDTPTPTPADDAVDATIEPDRTPSTDVARMPLGGLDSRIRYARELTTAGDLLPKDFRGRPGAVLLAIETGGMLGIHPVAALNGINVIEGKPSISPALMTALVRRAGHTLRVGTSGSLEAGTLTAWCTITRSDDPEHTFRAEWTPHRALRAGLLDRYAVGDDGMWVARARSQRGAPLPWEKYTEAMLKARAISEVAREAAEDALMGVHYTPEELGAVVDGDGDVVEATLVPDETPPPPPVPSPEEAARIAFNLAARCQSVEELGRFISEDLWQKVEGYPWARSFGTLQAFAQRVEVDTRSGRKPLIDAIAVVEKHLREKGEGQDGTGGAQNGRQEPPRDPAGSGATTPPPNAPQAADESDPWADGGAMGTPPARTAADPDADVVDAEVVEDDPRDTEANKVPTNGDAIRNVVRHLDEGAQVVDADRPADLGTGRRAADNARAELAAERDDPAADQGHRHEPPAGDDDEPTGRAAWDLAKQRLADLQKEAREKGATQ